MGNPTTQITSCTEFRGFLRPHVCEVKTWGQGTRWLVTHEVTILRSRISTRFCLNLQTGSTFDGTSSLSFLPSSFHPSNTISCPLATFEAQVKLTERTRAAADKDILIHQDSSSVSLQRRPILDYISLATFPHSLSLSVTEVVATASLAELQKDSKPHRLDPAVFNTFPELLHWAPSALGLDFH